MTFGGRCNLSVIGRYDMGGSPHEVSLSDLPHPLLVPLLEKYAISWGLFRKRGRPPAGVSEKRSAIVTDLHMRGTPWEDMKLITGLTQGGIQRNTKAMGNEASKQNQRDIGAKVGHARKGEKKPWLSEQMKRAWTDGVFDFHRGREIPEDVVQKIKAGWTSDVRAEQARVHVKLWADPKYRGRLLSFHRSPDERARRSREQVKRLTDDPKKWSRGRGCYVDAKACVSGHKLWVRSSYEKEAVLVLDADPAVLYYQYEERFESPDGAVFLPDFVVERVDGTWLIEVKASWVLRLAEDHPVTLRLKTSRDEAQRRGWKFHIWTEKDVLHAYNKSK